MIYFPAAKVNLGLYVEQRRPDGFHDLLTCFVQIPWRDMLEVMPWQDDQFRLTGLPVQGAHADNLIIKARDLLRSRYPFGGVFIHLHKLIPMGAGLGGGSSDAAMTLKALAQVMHLPVNKDELAEMAAQLGSDCPLFLQDGPQIGTGRGTELKPIDIPDLAGKTWVVVHPGIHVGTKEAYGLISPQPADTDLERILQLPAKQWAHHLRNDFEAPICQLHPAIAAIIALLRQKGALYAAMSGSGSAVFALFDDAAPVSETDFPSHYHFWKSA